MDYFFAYFKEPLSLNGGEECGVLGTSEVVKGLTIEFVRTTFCLCHVLAVIAEFYTRFMY